MYVHNTIFVQLKPLTNLACMLTILSLKYFSTFIFDYSTRVQNTAKHFLAFFWHSSEVFNMYAYAFYCKAGVFIYLFSLKVTTSKFLFQPDRLFIISLPVSGKYTIQCETNFLDKPIFGVRLAKRHTCIWYIRMFNRPIILSRSSETKDMFFNHVIIHLPKCIKYLIN